MKRKPPPEPILIECEGAGAQSDYCPMCSARFAPGVPIPPHKRLDILAMIDRGDF